MKALITGSNGFSAWHLADRLNRDSIRVIGLDIRGEDPCLAPFEEVRQVDITDFEALSRMIREVQPDYIFHLAGMMGGPFQEVYKANVLGTVTLLESVRTAGLDVRILLVGSSAEYGPISPAELPVTEEAPCRPFTPYGLSKYFATLAGQSYARRHGMKVVVARVFNLMGAGIPESLVAGALLARAKLALDNPAPPEVRVGNLQSQRDFVSVTDAVETYVRMAEGDFWGEVFNVCSGRAWPIAEVVQMLFAHSPRKIELKVDPELVRSSEVDVIYGSNDKARRLLGFEARTPLQDALKSAWDYKICGNRP